MKDVKNYRAGPDVLEVYLVDRLLDFQPNPGSAWEWNLNTGGGWTDAGTGNDAFVVLEIGKAQHNRYLFAHELGHVLGLKKHPTATSQCK